MSTEAAYVSTTDSSVREYRQWIEDAKTCNERISEFRTRHDPAGKLTLRVWKGARPRIAYFEGDAAPPGMRRRPDGRILPDRRTRAGKAIAAEITALDKAAPPSRPCLAGMPAHLFTDENMWFEPGMFLHEDAVWVHWGDRPEGVDHGLWREVKLSEFHAAKEAFDALHEHPLAASGEGKVA